MEIWDISRALNGTFAQWPGDTPFSFHLTSKMSDGAAVNVGAIEMSVHNGTHADAPFHFEQQSPTIEKMPLESYIGRAVVAQIPGGICEIDVSHLGAVEHDLAHAPRLLLKTDRWLNSAAFPKSIPVISPEVAPWLRARGVKLLGVDLPSVDAINAKDLANHHALTAAGITIVESLDLSAIAPGLYHFAGLPLKIEGGDGAPVRAILWRD
ncbi:MAG: cyclase family protein [Chthoniobacterales bacterium]